MKQLIVIYKNALNQLFKHKITNQAFYNKGKFDDNFVSWKPIVIKIKNQTPFRINY